MAGYPLDRLCMPSFDACSQPNLPLVCAHPANIIIFLPLVYAPARDRTCSLGICPDEESNQ